MQCCGKPGFAPCGRTKPSAPRRENPATESGKRLFLAGSGGRIFRMKGNAEVIDKLNQALREELTAINQYFLHAEMYENWGYEKLARFIKKQSIGEMKHAESIMERILFLDGTPSMEPLALTIGKNVKEMLQSDLELELAAVTMYNDAVQIAMTNKDNGSRDLFVELLKDEEEHVDWLEAQMHQIEEIGYERYLLSQTAEG